MKRGLLIAGAVFVMCLSGCNEKGAESTVENRTESTAEMTRSTTAETLEEVTPESTTTEAEAYSDYKINYTDTKGWVNILSENKVQVAAEIENTGTTTLYVSEPGCDLEDKDGNLVEVVSYIHVCPSIIEPGEKCYVYGTTTIEDYPGDNELNVVIRPDIEELRIKEVQYEVSDVSLKEDNFGDINVQGRITNTSNEVQSMNYVEVILFDENHLPIGYDYKIIPEDIKPNDKISFETSVSLPDFATMENVADYLIYAHPMQIQY